ncbi:uncharacterized protein QYS62_004097 [Fusarium acuminatum]|uniref:Erythromycin biosynthesis protein CIII-like C-terminal domain-containing protein n=1 Tax=Fusarium acuminatum TaxID=5515 RepID=A0ABZ2WS84_9HYPO
MFNRSLVLGAALIAAVSIFLSRPTLDLHPPYVQGRNGTALFLVNEQHGLSNVHVATASALLENYPDIEVHFASFPRLKAKLERIKQLAQKTNSEARIAFHRLQGFPYPLPWRKIPENLYLNLRVIYSVIRMPELAAKRKWLPAKGIADPLNFLGAYRHDAPWVTVTTEGASIPADYIPPNVTATNPIILSVAPAPELVEWLKKAPTILINLGSTVMYTEAQASVMIQAITKVLDQLNVQFLWKFNKYGNYSNNIFLPVQRYIENGQLRLERWLTVDPTSILETGRFIASVHHGGANCYNEAVYAGIPQIVMPLWADLYNYAVLVESIGIGVWACPNTSPDWTVEKLALAILKVVDGGKASLLMRSKARELGNRIQASEKGRDIAARKVAELAHTGKYRVVSTHLAV